MTAKKTIIRFLFLAALIVALLSVTSLASKSYAQKNCDSTLSQAEKITITNLIQKEITLEDSEKYDSAIQVNLQVLAICPDLAAAMTTIAGLYGKEGNFNKEIEWSRKAIAADSTFINAYINLANAYGLLGNTDMARLTLNDVIRRYPDSPEPYYAMGVLAEGESKLPEALSWYDKSIQIDSTFEDAIYNVAMIHARMGEKQIAIGYLKRILVFNPSDEQTKNMIEQLKEDIENEKSDPAKQGSK